MIKLKSKEIKNDKVDVKIKGNNETMEEIVAGMFGLLETIQNHFDERNLDSVIELINKHFRSDKDE